MRDIKGSTRLIALIGNPVKHSKSPYIHNHSFEKLELDYAYMAFDIEKGLLKDTVDAMKVLNIKGFNVTMPYKEDIIKYLDEVKRDAKLIGSVNTVLNKDGKLIGYNTDGKGFLMALDERNIAYNDKKIVILGAGGSAKAIALELALKGAKEIVIVNRTLEKAEIIRDKINIDIKTAVSRALILDERLLKEELKDSSILVNTTSVGMGSTIYRSIVNDSDIFHRDLFVADLIYEPARTRFLAMAGDSGSKTMNGLSMLLYQGALAFKIWTGLDMPKDIIEKIEKKNFYE